MGESSSETVCEDTKFTVNCFLRETHVFAFVLTGMSMGFVLSMLENFVPTFYVLVLAVL